MFFVSQFACCYTCKVFSQPLPSLEQVFFFSLDDFCSRPASPLLTRSNQPRRHSSNSNPKPTPASSVEKVSNHPNTVHGGQFQQGNPMNQFQYTFYNRRMNQGNGQVPFRVTYPSNQFPSDPYMMGSNPSDPYSGQIGAYNPYPGAHNPLHYLAFTTPGCPTTPHHSLPRRQPSRNHVWFEESSTREDGDQHRSQVRFSNEENPGIEMSLVKPTRPRSLTFSLDTLGEERANNNRSGEELGEDDWKPTDYENLASAIKGQSGGGGGGIEGKSISN